MGALSRKQKGEKDLSPPVLVRASLTQTRLNAFVEADSTYSTAFNIWASRIRADRGTFSQEALTKRLNELDVLIPQMEKKVRFPEQSTDPSTWLEQRAQLAKLTGQQAAIQKELERPTGPTPPPGSFMSSAVKGTAWDPTQDPFESE